MGPQKASLAIVAGHKKYYINDDDGLRFYLAILDHERHQSPPPTATQDVLTSAALDIQNLVASKSGVKCATLQAANKLVWAEQSLDSSNTKQLNAQ